MDLEYSPACSNEIKTVFLVLPLRIINYQKAHPSPRCDNATSVVYEKFVHMGLFLQSLDHPIHLYA